MYKINISEGRNLEISWTLLLPENIFQALGNELYFNDLIKCKCNKANPSGLQKGEYSKWSQRAIVT